MHPCKDELVEAIGEICELASIKTDNRERLQSTLDGIREVISRLYAPKGEEVNAHHSR